MGNLIDNEFLREVSRDVYFWIRPDPAEDRRIEHIPHEHLSYRVYKCADIPAPTLFLGHGCNGTDWMRDGPYVQDANAWGYNVVIVDSWGPRGIRECCKGRKPWYQPMQRRHEFYNVARLIKSQPWHRGKIGYLGWSHGGSLALCIAGDNQDTFAAAVAYYPNGNPYMVPNRKMLIPTLIHQGDSDTWTPVKLCDDIQGDNLTRLIHPGAGHCFDTNKIGRYRFEEWLIYHEESDKRARAATKTFLQQHLNLD